MDQRPPIKVRLVAEENRDREPDFLRWLIEQARNRTHPPEPEKGTSESRSSE